MPVLPPTPTPSKKKKEAARAKARAMAEAMGLKKMDKTGWRSVEGKMLIGDIRKKYVALKGRKNPIKELGFGQWKPTMPKWGRPQKWHVPAKRVNDKRIT